MHMVSIGATFLKEMLTMLDMSYLERMENRIKVVLVDKKKTNKWLAEQMGCAPTTVSKWCTNACQPPMETFVKIAELLEVDINELLRKD